ncbi:hypothetical protein HanIR_Chr13g0665991 [Helianthus annuus]|nr:hypothetical protein HanIR_Chr13g0665991 [Helianthus annuus]
MCLQVYKTHLSTNMHEINKRKIDLYILIACMDPRIHLLTPKDGNIPSTTKITVS